MDIPNGHEVFKRLRKNKPNVPALEVEPNPALLPVLPNNPPEVEVLPNNELLPDAPENQYILFTTDK